MPDPTRPVDAAEIETAWGQAVHDATFAPKGCHVSSTTSKACGSSFLILYMDTAVSDPGGWANLTTEKLTVPAGAGGLYLMHARLNTVNGTAGESTRAGLFLNGSFIDGSSIPRDGSTNVKFGITAFGILAAADVIDVRAQQTGGGAADVTMSDFWVIRIGSEIGA